MMFQWFSMWFWIPSFSSRMGRRRWLLKPKFHDPCLQSGRCLEFWANNPFFAHPLKNIRDLRLGMSSYIGSDYGVPLLGHGFKVLNAFPSILFWEYVGNQHCFSWLNSTSKDSTQDILLGGSTKTAWDFWRNMLADLVPKSLALVS